MAVEIPRIQRFEPQAPTSVGRLDVQAPNIVGATAPLTSALGESVNTVLKANQERELQIQKQTVTAWDIKSTDLSNQYENWHKVRLAEIKNKTGDTTEDYAELDKQSQEKYNQLFGSWKQMDPQFQQMLDKKVNSVYGKQQTFRDIQQSEQRYKYENNVTDNKVKLSQDSFLESGLGLDLKKPETFLGLQSYANDIVQSRIAQGDRTGTLRRDDKGVPMWLEGEVGVAVRRDMGNAVIPLVKSLNAAGKTKEGKKVIDDYSDYLNAKDRAALLSDNDESDVKNQALNALANIVQSNASKGLADPSPTIAQINASKDLSELVKQKMRQFNHDNNIQADREKTEKAETVMNAEYTRLAQFQSDPKRAYPSEAAYMDSPEFKAAKSLLNASQQSTLIKLSSSPTESSADAIAEMREGFRTGSIGGWSNSKYLSVKANLNAEDKRTLDKYYEWGTKPASQSAIQSMAKTAANDLTNQMMSYYNKFNEPVFPTRMKSGKKVFRDADDEKLAAKYDTMIQDEISLIKQPTVVQKNEIVKQKLREMEAEKETNTKNSIFGGLSIFARDVKRKLKGYTNTETIPTSTITGKNSTLSTNAGTGTQSVDATNAGMESWSANDWRNDFQKANGRKPRPEEIPAWKKQRSK